MDDYGISDKEAKQKPVSAKKNEKEIKERMARRERRKKGAVSRKSIGYF